MCRLFVTLNSEVVAIGFILQTDVATIHEVEIGSNIIRVEVKVIFDPSANLPIPVFDKVFLVKHALGTFVP